MITKTEKWIQKIKQTKEKRKSQVCKVYELKIDKSHLSKEKLSYLKSLFLEAKWLYNNILATENVFKYDTKIKNVNVLNKEQISEVRELKNLSSQMRQAVNQKIMNAIKALSAKKKKGKQSEVGKLKFKSKVNSIVLNQYNITYKIFDKYFSLQGNKSKFKIIGLNQIPENAEFANATLTQKNGDYYLKVTCYLEKEEKYFEGDSIGIDFGIKDSLTLSNGEKFDVNFPINDRQRKLQRKLRKMKRGSRNKYKLQNKINIQSTKIVNQKKDSRNKIVSYITNKFQNVIVQNENIKAWQSGGFGKKIQASGIGGIMSDLKRKSHTLILVDKFFPSTKLCPCCGQLNNPTLSDRIYSCECGYSFDRDIHAAKNIEREGLKQIGRESINTMPVEEMLDKDRTSVLALLFPLKQEAFCFS